MRKIYCGVRFTQDSPADLRRVVTVKFAECKKSYPLPIAHKHSEDFEWGYGGSGPAELAYCILLDLLNDKREAEQYYQQFKWKFISSIQTDVWTIASEQIEIWLQIQRKERFKIVK
jgi:hypothetical protein